MADRGVGIVLDHGPLFEGSSYTINWTPLAYGIATVPPGEKLIGSGSGNAVYFSPVAMVRSKGWDGTKWVSMQNAVIWDGTNWIPYASGKAWDGSSWVAV